MDTVHTRTHDLTILDSVHREILRSTVVRITTCKSLRNTGTDYRNKPNGLRASTLS